MTDRKWTVTVMADVTGRVTREYQPYKVDCLDDAVRDAVETFAMEMEPQTVKVVEVKVKPTPKEGTNK